MPKTSQSHSISVESIASAGSKVYTRILDELKTRDYSQDDIFAVHLALEEGFVNAIKHGNKMNRHKKVTVDYVVNAEKIEIFITDQGAGFSPESVPDPRVGENIYKTGGRGLFLIRSYMDKVDFNERGNRLCIIKFKS